MEEKISGSIQELQSLETNLQQLLMQKQSFELELTELLNAIDEVGKTNDEVYKVLSGLMIKANKEELKNQLQEKKKIIENRISIIDKKQISLENEIESLKKEISKLI